MRSGSRCPAFYGEIPLMRWGILDDDGGYFYCITYRFRHKAKLKEQFPNEDSLERFACMVYCDYNRRFSGKAHRGFQEACLELLEMFAD